eukprot:TRINITY_DN3261_c0_g11_i1.p1 TRINITY_DN3261_c0_g11~~TRINITY_DN3261_c0_g11_i1.p1  ORF type:complete len:132 (-),score=6.29 TRINITY_DN3261_c0_g11_i1:62-457(-)
MHTVPNSSGRPASPEAQAPPPQRAVVVELQALPDPGLVGARAAPKHGGDQQVQHPPMSEQSQWTWTSTHAHGAIGAPSTLAHASAQDPPHLGSPSRTLPGTGTQQQKHIATAQLGGPCTAVRSTRACVAGA